MRKVTKDIVSSFMNGEKKNIDNSFTETIDFKSRLYLHGNLIAVRERDTGNLYITDAGWQTNTTKERLNGIPGVSVCQKKGQWYLNGKEWDGSLTLVGDW